MSLKQYPLLLFYSQENFLNQSDFIAQTAFTVSKKNFKRAVDRNAIKRKLRESYRLQKSRLYQLHVEAKKQYQLKLVFVYIGDKMPTYQQVNDAMRKLIDKLAEQ